MKSIKGVASAISFRRLAAALLIAVLVPFTTAGCIIDDEVDKAVKSFDDAIAALDRNSADWQNVLNGLIRELETFDKDIQEKILPDVKDLLSYTVGAAGEEVRCDADFFGARVRQHLVGIRAKLTNEPAQAPPPVFCITTPDIIDLRNPPNSVAVSGYDFNGNPPVHVYARRRSDPIHPLDLTPRIARTAGYHLNLNLSPNYGGDKFVLNNDIDRFIFMRSPNDPNPLYELTVVPKTCRKRIENIPAGAHVYLKPGWVKDPNVPDMFEDPEFDGNVHIKVESTLNWGGSHPIIAWVHMRALENGGNHTLAEGTAERSIYQPPNGTAVVGVAAPGIDSYSDDFHEDKPEGPKSYPGSAFVDRYMIRGDHDGDDAGVYTDVDAFYKKDIEVQLVENQDCIPQ